MNIQFTNLPAPKVPTVNNVDVAPKTTAAISVGGVSIDWHTIAAIAVVSTSVILIDAVSTENLSMSLTGKMLVNSWYIISPTVRITPAPYLAP